MTANYRWNVADNAAAFDRAAPLIHPLYTEIQGFLLARIPLPRDSQFLLVDLGGGSGRLAERFLEQFEQARALVIDQSPPFLELARARLARFGGRGQCHQARLQDDWTGALDQPAAAIVSTSAIHHLEPAEKQALYARGYRALAEGGVLLNGDEVRPETDDDYLTALRAWVAHKRQLIDAGSIDDVMARVLAAWEERNIGQFGRPRKSGDDCHETIATQLDCLRQVGFRNVAAPWQRQMWAVLEGVK